MIDAPGALTVLWTKSTRSCHAGQCVEIAHIDGGIAVRDSKDPDGPRLSFSYGAWRQFIADIRDGRFDLPEGA